jgi:hypothetical protein
MTAMKHASLLLLICMPCAFAQDWQSSYSYIGAGYGQIDQETLGLSVDLDGYYLEVSGGNARGISASRSQSPSGRIP